VCFFSLFFFLLPFLLSFFQLSFLSFLVEFHIRPVDGLNSAKMLQSFSLQHVLAWLGILLGGGVFYVSSLTL
jgi:hypothetical protein